jgi:type IV pilus assembly protein PilW
MKSESGLTLVEILVAMVIVLVVVAASTAFITRGRAAHRASEAMAQIEESLDAGFSMLSDEIRLAGYLGLAPPATPVAGSSALGSVERRISPSRAIAASRWRSILRRPLPPSIRAKPPRPACRSAVVLRRMVALLPPPIRWSCAMRRLRRAARRPGRLQLETNLRSAALAANAIPTLGADTRWHDLEVGVYYVSRDSTGRKNWPSLRRKRLVGGTRPAFQDEELVSGIADLQVMIGLDDLADLDAAVDRWINPGEPTLGGTTRALRIELEAQSDIPEPGLPA